MSGGCGGDGDVVAHGFELGDESSLPGVAVSSPVEVVGAEVGVGLAGGQQVPGDDQDAVADGDGGFAWPSASADAVVVGAEVGVLGSPGGLAGLSL